MHACTSHYRDTWVEFLLFLMTCIYYLFLPSRGSLTNNLSPYFNIKLPSCWNYWFQRVTCNEHKSLAGSQIRKMPLNHFDRKGFYFVSSGAVALQACWPRAFAHHRACAEDNVGDACKHSKLPSFLPTASRWQGCFEIAQFHTKWMHILQRCADCFF